MCWMCDHPGSTRDDYLDYIRDMIACCGWGIQGVERSEPHPPWAYSVGLTLADRPELVVTGMSLRRGARLLNGSGGPPDARRRFHGRASRSG
jgi:poly-beta-hydroxyalkanoate depolymerase